MKFLSKSRKGLFFLSCFIFFLLIFYFIYFFFRVTTIKVFGKNTNYGLLGLDNFKATNLLFVDTKLIKDKLYDQNPAVKKISVNKSWPNTLEIIVEFQKPVAYLKSSSGKIYLSSNSRIIYKKKSLVDNNQETLPQINFYQKVDFYSISAGDNLDYDDLIEGLKFLLKANELGLKTNTIDISGSYMIRLKLDNKEILFSSEKRVDNQLAEFDTVIRDFKIRGQDYKKLDFRFEKPIVEF